MKKKKKTKPFLKYQQNVKDAKWKLRMLQSWEKSTSCCKLLSKSINQFHIHALYINNINETKAYVHVKRIFDRANNESLNAKL